MCGADGTRRASVRDFQPGELCVVRSVVRRCIVDPRSNPGDRAWFQHLKLKHDEQLSNFAFNFNLHPYTVADRPSGALQRRAVNKLAKQDPRKRRMVGGYSEQALLRY